MKVAIQCSSIGQRCGIYTYTCRLEKALKKKGIKTEVFYNRPLNDFDIISLQYEPGIIKPNKMMGFLQSYSQPIVVTAHHIGYLPQIYHMIDGIVFHDESQFKGTEPWNYTIIPHPAIVYPKKNKSRLRKKYDLPQDKLIVGTAGFITGTGKNLPLIVEEILKRLNKDEFLYLITAYWKAGDMGREREIKRVVKKLGKEDNFRIDTEFVDEKTLNEKMQCCDLLFAWNMTTPNHYGSQSGIASDMYGSWTKLIVKDTPHYNFIKKQEGVLVGRIKPNEFAEDVIKALRSEDLDDVPDPTWLSWDNQVEKYIEYFKEFI